MNLREEKLVEILRENNFVTDLKEFSIDANILQIILGHIKKESRICKIIWNEFSYKNIKFSKNHVTSLLNNIEEELIENTQIFEKFPSDFILCLMSKHVNENESVIRKLALNMPEFNEDENKAENLKSVAKYLEDKNWKIEKTFSKHGYKSLLCRNNETKQFALAFQGATLKVRDFFLGDDNQIKSLIESVL
jgi:hypothetical protein